MKNYRQIFLAIPIFLLLSTTPSYGASSEVKVNSVTNTSSASTNSTSGNTHIRIETNGIVKECDSKNGDCSHLESEDGSSKVDVNNNSIETSKIRAADAETISAPTPTGTKSASTFQANEKKEKKVDKPLNIFDEIEQFFKSFFEKLKIKF